MKRIKLILACGLVLALTGLTTLLVAAGASGDRTAIVKDVKGNVTYKLPEGGDFKPLKVNQELAPGTVIKSGPGATAYLSVNGVTSAVKIQENTTVTLSKMTATGEDSSTSLKLDGGTLLGSVKKVTATSDYNVVVPGGVAAIRGTDWEVTVTYQGSGNFTVTFTSGSGTVYCTVTLATGVAGQNTQNLTTGQSWTVTGTTSTTGQTTITTVGNPTLLPPIAFAALQAAITELHEIVPITPPPPPGGGGGGNGGGPPVIPQPLPPTGNPSNLGGGGARGPL